MPEPKEEELQRLYSAEVSLSRDQLTRLHAIEHILADIILHLAETDGHDLPDRLLSTPTADQMLDPGFARTYRRVQLVCDLLRHDPSP